MNELMTPIPAPPTRKRGGQVGNNNALKHGFYTRSFTRSDQQDIETYTFKGLQDEIAALRLLNRRAIAQALASAENAGAFQDAARIVTGLMLALNATLRTQMELDARGGSEFDAMLDQALEDASKDLGIVLDGKG